MSDYQAAPLIAAKYSIPPVRPGAVARTRLHEQLMDTSYTPLTTVVAPAGWGKTTVLVHWADDPAETRHVVWVSLDTSDDEPARFWSYVLTALTLGVDGLTADALKALSTAGATPMDLALPQLLNDLNELTSESVLVLDDYHLIDDPQIHQDVEFLVGYLPAALRLVIAGRFDPPLPLARMRARGELTEIRAAQLRFAEPEALALLSAVTASAFDPGHAAELCEKAEGWAAGLQLAGLAIRASSEPTTTSATLRGDDRHILDYLSTEVLAHLDSSQRELLVRTAVLERLSGPLCDAVLHRHGSADVLHELERRDMFVTALDPDRQWFRCHGLLRELLVREQGEDADHPAANVLSDAATWFLERGYVADAIDVRIQAEDFEGAAELLRTQVMWFIGHGAAASHLQLGERLPRRLVVSDPMLCISLAWTAAFTGQNWKMAPWLDAAERFSMDQGAAALGWSSLRGAVLTMRARYNGTAGADDPTALRHAEEAVRVEVDPTLPGYVVARTVLGITLSNLDRSWEAVRPLDAAWKQARTQALYPLPRLQAASALAVALFDTRRLDQLRRLLTDIHPTVEACQEHWGPAVGPGLSRLLTVQGQLAHHDGDIVRATILLDQAVELARIFGEPTARMTALLATAQIQLDRRDPAAAHASISEAREVADNDHVPSPILDRLTAMDSRVGRPSHSFSRTDVLLEELTERERAVLRGLAGDGSQREIGKALFLSINTVKGYTKSLYRKLGVGTRKDAVSRGRSLGLM